MSDSPEAVVRRFLAAWAHPDASELGGFFDDDAVWVDGPQGVRHGAAAIVTELTSQLTIGGGGSPEIDTLLADDGIVMVEWRGELRVNGQIIPTRVMAVFELDAAGRITQMRECYDLQSLLNQIAAASGSSPAT
ncbi:MAG: nuclear transport factor 2 family protein [Acidimicrobiia bacterium]|nr:nuclear transport factor 2 family protein [Acidimicrobiia bacterium]